VSFRKYEVDELDRQDVNANYDNIELKVMAQIASDPSFEVHGSTSGRIKPKPVDNFDVFRDRAESLLSRWTNFRDNNPQATPARAIAGFLDEINDAYTNGLMAPEDKTVRPARSKSQLNGRDN
jgi:hypothetical protein